MKYIASKALLLALIFVLPSALLAAQPPQGGQGNNGQSPQGGQGGQGAPGTPGGQNGQGQGSQNGQGAHGGQGGQGPNNGSESVSVLKKFANSTDKVMILAHRGGSQECVENTIEAFQYAADLGSHILEMDIQLTKDGKVVVVHDTNLLRLTGVDKNVSDLDYADLPPITLSTSDLACCKKNNLRRNDGGNPDRPQPKVFRIPTLEQVLKRFPDVVLHIELKDGSTELMEATANLLAQYNREDDVIWGHEDQTVCDQLLQYNANIRRIFPAQQVLAVYVSYIMGTFASTTLSYYSLGIPKLETLVGTQTGNSVIDAYLADLDFLKTVTKVLFPLLRQKGVLASFYDMSTTEDFDYAMEYSVGGIIVDTPAALKAYLIENDMYL